MALSVLSAGGSRATGPHHIARREGRINVTRRSLIDNGPPIGPQAAELQAEGDEEWRATWHPGHMKTWMSTSTTSVDACVRRGEELSENSGDAF